MWVSIKSLISPKKFFAFSHTCLPWLSIIFFIVLLYGLVGSFLAPADYIQGEAFRIIYVHVPCAFLSLLIYSVMTIAAVFALTFRLKLAFAVIRHSLPLGASFTFLALLTGALWGKPMWGTWWLWDARLTSELILFFLYLGMLLFQSAVAHRSSGERALAILVLVGFVDIPIIHYSVYWWNTLHQGATLKIFAPSAIDPAMLHPLIAMIAAFILFYGIILCLSINDELLAQDHFSLKPFK